MKKQKPKNGKIELLRFIFCLIILIFHTGEHLWYNNNIIFNDRFDISFFAHGMIAVEFFFIVSGYLLAKEINKKSKETKKKITSEQLSKEWIDYLKKKIKAIFPTHTVAFVIAFICASLFREYNLTEMIKCLITSIPQFFFLQMTGLRINDTYPNNVEWYISAMLVAIAIIYPIFRKYKDGFSKIGAPLIAILGSGYLISSLGRISATIEWHHFIMGGTLRAITMMCLGICSYNISESIKNKKLTKQENLKISILEITTFVITLLYVVSSLSRKYEAIVVFLIFTFVTIAFSEQGILKDKLNNKIIYFLGKISLPIYLSHLPAINLTKAFFINENIIIKIILVITFTTIFTSITYILGNKISKLINKDKKTV